MSLSSKFLKLNIRKIDYSDGFVLYLLVKFFGCMLSIIGFFQSTYDEFIIRKERFAKNYHRTNQLNNAQPKDSSENGFDQPVEEHLAPMNRIFEEVHSSNPFKKISFLTKVNELGNIISNKLESFLVSCECRYILSVVVTIHVGFQILDLRLNRKI